MFGAFAISTFTPFLVFPLFPGDGFLEEVEMESQEEKITHNWNYAYEIWGIDFVKLIECENGRWDPKRVSKTHDHWLCQLHYKYNKKFIDSSDFNDPYKQLDYCYEKYKVNPKLRYWPDRKIKGKKCTDYVDDRFDIL